MNNTSNHHGRNIKRIREILGIKQQALAWELGEDWTQKKISILEQRDTVKDDVLAKLSLIFKIPISTIKDFDETVVINSITNATVSRDDSETRSPFYPGDTVLELYIELLKSEKEKVRLLEKWIQEKK